jgi:PhnB protein
LAEKTPIQTYDHVNHSSREQVKSVMASAETEGATLTMKPDQMPWAAFYGRLIDPFGHSWSFAAD